MPSGAELTLPDHCPERAAYVVSGQVSIDGESYSEGVMAVACTGKEIVMKAHRESRVMVVGGDPVGDRYIWWNFVSSSRERIEQAKADWRRMKFDKVPGETEFIPLPG